LFDVGFDFSPTDELALPFFTSGTLAEGTVAEGTVAEGTVAEGTVAEGTVAEGTVVAARGAEG
jgi:hypothetical protein